MLMGQPMPVPYCRGPYKGPPLEQLQMELRSYMKKLTVIHKAIYLQEKKKRYQRGNRDVISSCSG